MGEDSYGVSEQAKFYTDRYEVYKGCYPISATPDHH